MIKDFKNILMNNETYFKYFLIAFKIAFIFLTGVFFLIHGIPGLFKKTGAIK
jgi:hypothetical protein